MMRAKRPRAPHSVGHAHGHARTRSMSDDNLGDDHLLHMDPSLMTERQQLAFLLRKTAQEQSGGDSPTTHSSDAPSDDDDEANARRPRKRIQHTKTSPRKSKPSAPPPRSRAAKNAKNAKTSPRAKPARLSAKRLHVKTASSPSASDAEAPPQDAAVSLRKPSPSSTSDIAHIGVFDDALDFWSLHCALCSSQLDASSEPLFLCQSCDKKYPTQRALGRCV